MAMNAISVRRLGQLLAIAVVATLAGCETMPEMMPGGDALANAGLKATKGNKTQGEVTFEQVGDKVRVVAQVIGLKPKQEHGFHIHEAGDCSSGDGMSAKGHFNPQGKPHGHYSKSDRHAGDMPNLKADAKGRVRATFDLDIVTVTPGPTSIIGRGLIIHADPDDYKSQPTGNAGGRLACAVIQAG
jgi:superoxide dismutase, Cu-Zn family